MSYEVSFCPCLTIFGASDSETPNSPSLNLKLYTRKTLNARALW